MHCEKPKIIEMQNVGMCYPQGDMALRDVDLCIHEGDFVAITGRNGGGKTTLVRLILQLLKPTAGAITYYRKGEQVKRLNMGYLPQKNSIDNRFPITIDEVVASGLDSMNRFFHRRNSSDDSAVQNALAMVGLSDLRHKGIGEISGGQLQRALLARAIIGCREVLVLDEPLSYLDQHYEQRLYQLIAQLSRHATIIMVSHDVSVVSAMANRHFIVERTLHECHCHHHMLATRCTDADLPAAFGPKTTE